MASYLVSDIGQVQDPSGCGPGSGNMLPAATAAASKAEAFALSQAGKPYLWGGAGPNAFDCSGLMLRAYESAGLILPRVAADQFRTGAYLPVRDAQPGDLLFWATDRSNPLTIHHVAMYLGNNTIVEAAHDGVPVGQRTISWSEPELMPQAVRPGV
jgi:cell wall-associated NlpC family hydrolase